MGVTVRPACLQDGVVILEMLEDVGYYPEPIAFAKTFRRTLHDPHFLVRVAEVGGKVVGVASLSLRYQLGHGGLVANLDEFAVQEGPFKKSATRHLRQATVGKARALGAVRVVRDQANTGTPPPRAAQRKALAAAAQAPAA
jgi:hypothetical protein